jgi:holo-ACP synthase
VLAAALNELDALACARRWRVLSREVFCRETGPEAIYVIDVEPRLLKLATVRLEDHHPLGRLWDLDVIEAGPRPFSRKQLMLPARRCFVCERPASECGRSRRHPLSDLLSAVHRIVNNYDLAPN